LNSKNVLDVVTLTVKLAVEEFGARSVAGELRRIARQLENTGSPVGNSREQRRILGSSEPETLPVPNTT
jgi:hypothetical protein